MTDPQDDQTNAEDDGGASSSAEPSPEQPGGDGFEEAVSELERVESKRRRIGAVVGVGALLVVGGAILLAAEFRGFLFQPRMPIEKNERKIVRRTDDPQCRELIADVTAIANDYYALESKLDQHVPGDDLQSIRGIDRKLVTLKQRLDRAKELSYDANLRYEKSRKELDKWFSYVDYEIGILREVIANQLADLRPGTGPDAGGTDATVGGDAGGDAASDGAGSAGRGDSDRTPTERRDGAMVALHDAFENFRVWHSGDSSKHPCGDNEKGETPWRPDDWEAGDAGSDV